MGYSKSMTNDCWLYAGSVNTDGYGIVFSSGKQLRAHRVMYEAVVGEIPEGMYSDHLCRVRICINPNHIELVDNVTNIMRGTAPSAQNARKQACSKGHELAGNNLITDSRGWRVCRQCKNRWLREFRAKN